jgi:hypothetical protein
MKEIDAFSLAAIPITMSFGNTELAKGTGFTWSYGEKLFLITNWHNVTGINPRTGKHLSCHAGEPDRVRLQVGLVGSALGTRGPVEVPLRGERNEPLWLEHPMARGVDVVALPLPPMPGGLLYSINLLPQERMLVAVGMDAFILGYPLGIGAGVFPIWERASIAGEPNVLINGEHYFYVDTATKKGMSGAPVILRTWGSYFTESGGLLTTGMRATRFIGVYSGRIGASDELQAQLGMVWHADLIETIVRDGRHGSMSI